MQVEDDQSLVGFVDADYAGNIDTRKFQTGYVYTLFGTAIVYKSCQKNVVALSTIESDYMVVTKAFKEGLWLLGILNEFGINQDGVKLLCDNQSALCLAKHQPYHER